MLTVQLLKTDVHCQICILYKQIPQFRTNPLLNNELGQIQDEKCQVSLFVDVFGSLNHHWTAVERPQ
jgi:hypothetical protein